VKICNQLSQKSEKIGGTL